VVLKGVEDGGDAGGAFEVPRDVVAQAGGGGENEDGVRRRRRTRMGGGAARGDGGDGSGGHFAELREGLALRVMRGGREGGREGG